MFQPSHFQKMAQHLAIDSLSYEKEYNAFMSKLKNFHESKGTPFRRLPWLGGQYLDLYLLYRKVTSSGGWVKVTEDKKWRDIAEVFNLPPTCTNAAFALRQHYARYLESFERINFFGEDAEDVLAAGRPHTPVTASIMPTHIAQDYISVISTSKDATRNFDKLVLSLQCGMPNEVDFAINICMLLSNVSNSVFNLSKAPAVVDTLLAHVGVFSADSHGLRELYDEWYIKQDVERDFIKFWKESLTVRSIRESLCGSKGDETSNEDSLFHPMRKRVGAKDVECQRVAQVCMILYNFSFDNTNANVLASHPLCLRFLVLCICGNHGFLQRMAWETLSNLAEKMVMEPIESTSTQMFFQMLHLFLDHKDRYHVTNAMDVLGKLCTLEGNDDVIEAGLEPEAYESLIKVLIVSDVQLVISSLESLYNLSGVGQVTSDHIAEVHRSIDVLVCLVTMDAASFGSEALSEVQIIENRAAATVPVTPKPQPTPIPVVPHQPKEPVQPHHVTHSSPSPSPAPNQAPAPPPTPTPVKTTGTEIDPETFTFNWLQGTYESAPGSSVSRIDIYADYLSSCSRLARVGILNATAFNRIIKLAFPDGQLRRAQSGTQVQYVLAGLRRKANPLPVKSRTDAPVHQQPGSVTPAQHPGQRVLPNPVQQGISRTPTSSTPPAWTVPKQQTTAGQQQSLAAPGQRFVQRSMQAPGVGQVVGTAQQAPGMIPLPRRPSVSSQGGNQVATDQGMRQFTEASIQQVRPNAPLSGHRQATGVPMQRAVAPLVQGQLPPSLRRTSTEGTGMSQGQNPQAFQQHHNQGPLMPQLERMPLPVQSQGLQRQVPPQQAANPMRVHQMPASPSQRIGPASFPQQLTTKSPQPLNLQGNVRIPQNPLARSPLPPHGPMQPPSPRPVSTPPPTSMVQRAPSPAMPSSYQPTPVYQQQPPAFPQQPIRQPSTGLNGRPSYGSYPPLAPKPAPGMSIQGFPQRTQVPANPGAPGGYPGFPQVPRSPHQQPGIVRQNFQSPRPPPNMPQSPVLAPASVGGRQPFAGPHKDLAGGFAGRNSRQAQGLDVRPTNGEPLPGCRRDGVVLIAQEERAADVVSTGLLEGAEEQKIVVVENRNRTEQESNAEVTKNSISNQDTQAQSRPPANNMVCGRVNDPRSKICEPLNMCTGDQHTLPNSPRTISTPASNGGLKRNFDIHTSEASKMPVLSEDGLNGQRDREGDNCGPLKRPRLDDRMPSFENDLENSSTLPCRTGSPTALVNGDIKGDPRNKLMDKLLDKDLHIPLNGVCGIDTSELDLMASDGERLSSSKASSPDLFGSETNSDFGKYLEESDTDTGLFSDVLQGDLRIDPMENGTEGQQHTQGHHKSVESKSLNMPSFRGGPFGESGNILNEKGATAVIAAQGKIPISPSIAPETQTLHDGELPGRNVAVVNRYPVTTQPLGGVTFNSAWNTGNTVALGSKPGFPQSFGTEVHQKIAPYPPQGKLLPNVDNRTAVQNTVLQNQRRDHAPTSTLGMQQNAFPLQNIPPNSQQMVVTHGTSRLLPSGVPQNILPRTPQTSVASSMVSGTQGMNVTRPSSAGPPPFKGGQQMHVGQTSASRVQPVGVPQNMSLVRGVQASDGSPSLVQQPQQQQPNLMPYPGPRMQGTTQNIVPGGLQVQAGMQRNSPGVSPGVQPHSMPPQQQLPNVYPDTRTRSMVTPGSSMFETTSVSQNRQPSATMPVQRQQPPPPLPPARKGIVQSPVGSIPGSMPGSEDIPFPPPLGNPTDTVVPQVDSFRPYKCRWATCFSSFDTSKGLFVHVVSEHVPRDSLVMSCMWEGCAPVRRSRSSLLFHMQQKHSEPSPGPSAPPPQSPAQHQPSPTQPPPQPQVPSSSQQTSFVPAYHFLARMLQSLQGEEESPLTKTVRLSAALVLRNIAQYSALARSMLRRHERHLSLVAMSNSEAANAVAACLSELSPHRKASCEDSDSFIWALNR